MNAFASLFFIVLAADLIFFASGFIAFGFLLCACSPFLSSFFVGLLFLFFEKHRAKGGGLLVAGSVSLLFCRFCLFKLFYPMNKFVKSLLFTSVGNVLLFALGFVEPGLFILFFVVAGLEFFVGLVLLIPGQTRETGGGMLVASAVTFLIGISVCSSSYTGHF